MEWDVSSPVDIMSSGTDTWNRKYQNVLVTLIVGCVINDEKKMDLVILSSAGQPDVRKQEQPGRWAN